MIKLIGKEGFAQIHDTAEIDDHPMVIMNVLGDNLRTLKDLNQGKLSLHTSLQIMHQVVTSLFALSDYCVKLSRLECLHEMGYVHCDLKPDNILSGLERTTDTNIYLVDFGLAHYFLD